VGCLPGGAEPAGDVAPRVPERAQSVDGVLGGGVELGGQAEQVGQGVDVSAGDAAAVGADDPGGEPCVVVVLHLVAAPVPAG